MRELTTQNLYKIILHIKCNRSNRIKHNVSKPKSKQTIYPAHVPLIQIKIELLRPV